MVKMNLLGVPITLTGSNRSGFLLNAFWLVKFKGISRKTCPRDPKETDFCSPTARICL